MPTPTYPDRLTVEPLALPPHCTIRVPGSKSLTNRAMILAALARGASTLEGALFSEDTEVMAESLRRLGIAVEAEAGAQRFRVEGRGGRIPAERADLWIGNSGTSIRFLAALCALGRGPYTLDGVPRMRERPQQPLLDALTDLGAAALSLAGAGTAPLSITSPGYLPGGRAPLQSEASSQFLTALLMVAPCARESVTLEIQGRLRPHYVEITRRMMAQWGVDSTLEGSLCSVVAGQQYRAQAAYAIEPDASSASYFFAAAALTGGQVTVPGLGSGALQGDVRFATEVLPAMGCRVDEGPEGLTVQGPPPGELRGVDLDMSAISDTSLTLAAIAPFASTPTTIRGVAHSRLQECDRVSAICTELGKLGVAVEERPDGFTISPTERFSSASLETYGDHRIAMSLALIGLRSPGVSILNPGCVAKTVPNYWELLEQLRT